MVATLGTVKFETRLDRSGLDQGLAQIKGRANDFKVDVGLNVDDTEIKLLRERLSNTDLKLKVRVDDRALTALNQHLDKKEQHVKQLQRMFDSSPLTPKVDLRNIERLEKAYDRVRRAPNIEIKAKVRVDEAEVERLAERTVVVRTRFVNANSSGGSDDNPLFDQDKLASDLGRAVRQGFKSAQGGGLAGIILAPFKAAGGIATNVAGTIGTGLLNGITEQVTKGLGRGLASAFENSLAPVFGSSELLAERVGGTLADGIVVAFRNNLSELDDTLQRVVDSIDDSKLRKKLDTILGSVRTAPGQVRETIQETIGQENIVQAALQRQRQQERNEEKRSREAAAQADVEFRRNRVEVNRREAQGARPEDIQPFRERAAAANQLRRSPTDPQSVNRARTSALEDFRSADAGLTSARSLARFTSELFKAKQAEFQQAIAAVAEAEKAISNFSGDSLDELASLERKRTSATEQGARLGDELQNLERNALDLNRQIADRAAELAEARERLQELNRPSAGDRPAAFLQIARAVTGSEFDSVRDRLPRLEVNDEFLQQSGANAGFSPQRNVILIRKELADALAKGEKLTREQIRTLSEELAQAFDLDFGSQQGLLARGQGQVLAQRQVQPTQEELAQIAPELTRYPEAVRAVELNGKIRAERATAQVIAENEALDLINSVAEIRQALDLTSAVGQLNGIANAARQIGISSDSLLKGNRDSLIAISDELDGLISSAASGGISGDALKTAITELRQRLIETQLFLNTTAAQLQELADVRAFRETALDDPFVRPAQNPETLNRAINLEGAKRSQVFPEDKDPFAGSFVTPRRTTRFGVEQVQFENEQQTARRERREELQRRLRGGLAGARDFVFNPDRNLGEINTDELAEKVVNFGRTLDKGVAFVQSIIDSPLGRTAQGVFQGGVATARNVYGGLQATETALFSAAPFNEAAIAKKAIRNTALPAGLAFAASQSPLLKPAVSGAIDLAQSGAGAAIQPFVTQIQADIATSVLGVLKPIGDLPAGVQQVLPQLQGAVENYNNLIFKTIEFGQRLIGAGSQFSTQIAGGAVGALGFGQALLRGGEAAVDSGTRALAGNSEGIRLQLPFNPGRPVLPAAVEATPTALAAQSTQIVQAQAQANAAAKRAKEIAGGVIDVTAQAVKSTNDIVQSAKEIQSRFSQAYAALKDTIAGGNKRLAEEQQKTILGVANQAKKDLDDLLGVARQAGDRASLVEIGQIKGRITQNVNRVRRRGNEIDAIDVSAQEVDGNDGLLLSASRPQGPNLFQRLRDRFARVLPLTDRQLEQVGENYRQIILAIDDISDATVGFRSNPDLIPGLRVADETLRAAGADAAFDAGQNVILITKRLAQILAKGPEDLAAYENELAKIVQEGRHSLQLAGGTISPSEAAAGVNVRLASINDLTAREALGVERSVAGATLGNANQDQLRRLEADGYIFERNTPEIIRRVSGQSDSQNVVRQAQQRLEELRKALSDRVKSIFDQVFGSGRGGSRALVPTGGQQIGFPASRIDLGREQQKLNEARQQIFEESDEAFENRVAEEARRAQRAADAAQQEIGNAGNAQRGASSAEAAFRAQERARAVADGVNASATNDLQVSAKRSTGIIGEFFQTVGRAFDGFNQDVEQNLRAVSSALAQDAAQLLQSITASRVDAENRSAVDPGQRARAESLRGIENNALGSIQGIDQILASTDRLDSKGRDDLRRFQDQLREVYAQLGQQLPSGNSGGLLGIGGRLSDLTQRFQGLAAAAGALFLGFQFFDFQDLLVGLRQGAIDAVQAAIGFERLQNSLSSIQGSSVKANEDLRTVSDITSQFGTSLQAGRQGLTQLRGAVQGTTVEGGATSDLFRAVQSFAAARGATQDQQERAFVALSQIASKGGAVSSEETRQQLAEALPGAPLVAARGLGLTSEEFQRRLVTSQIGSTDFIEAFTRQALAENLAGAERNANSLNGQLQILQNTVVEFQETSGKGLAPAALVGTRVLNTALSFLKDNLTLVGAAIASASVLVVQAAVPALKVLAVQSQVAGAALGGLSTGLLGLAKASPIVLGLVFAFQTLGQEYTAFQQAFTPDQRLQQLGDFAESSGKRVDELRESLNRLGRTEVKGPLNLRGRLEGTPLDPNQRNNVGAISAELIQREESGGLGRLFQSVSNPLTGGINVEGIRNPLEFVRGVIQRRTNQNQQDRIIREFEQAALTDTDFSAAERALSSRRDLDNEASRLRGQRSIASADPGNIQQIREIDDRLRKIQELRRSPENAFAQEAQGIIRANISQLQQEIEAEVDPFQRRRLDQRLQSLQAEESRLNDIAKRLGVNISPVQKLNDELRQLSLELSKIEQNSKIDLQITNDAIQGNLADTIGTDQFAEQRAGLQTVQAELANAQALAEQQAEAITRRRANLDTEDVRSSLAGIRVGRDNRVIDLNSPLPDIEAALADGATGDAKTQLEQLQKLRQAEQQQRDTNSRINPLRTQELQQRSQFAGTQLDNREEERQLGIAQDAARQQAALNEELLSGQLQGENNIAIRRAELQAIEVQNQKRNLEQRKSDFKAVEKELTADERVKRNRELLKAETDITRQEAEAQLAIREAVNRKIIADFERVVRQRQAAIEETQFNRSFASQSGQFFAGEVTGLGGAAQTAAINRDAIQEQIRLSEQQIAGIKEQVANRVRTESEGADAILQIESQLRSQRQSLLDAQIQETERLTQVRIDAVAREAQAIEQGFEAEKQVLSQRSQLLERQSQLIQGQRDLANATSGLRIATLTGRESDLGERRQSIERLRSGEAGDRESRELRRQLRVVTEPSERQVARALRDEQAIQREIEAEKASSLEQQQRFAFQLLAIEEKRAEIAQKIAEIEARSAEVRARQSLGTANLELFRAERTGDRDQITAARENVGIASTGLQLAQDNVAFTKELGSSIAEEFATRRETLGLQNRTEAAQLNQENARNERQRRLEGAKLGDELGIGVNSGNALAVRANPVTALEELNRFISQPLDAPGNEIAFPEGSFTTVEALLARIAKNTEEKGTVTNVFNGGEDSVDQYAKFKKEEQNQAARSLA